MNVMGLAWRQLSRRPLQMILNAFVMGLGIAVVVLLILGQDQLRERMNRDASGIDLVVGSPGSPMQLLLSSVYHVDVPIGNIPLRARDVVEQERAVKYTIPLALGDNREGFRIVGTEPSYAEHYQARFRAGGFWSRPMQAVLGAEAARQTGLSIGDQFAGQHGLGQGGPTHGDHPYEVVGILDYNGSVIDRLILTAVESVWKVHEGHQHGSADDARHDHEHEHEQGHRHGHSDRDHEADHDEHEHADDGAITALLVRYASPMAATRLPTRIDNDTPWQAARPAHESARLFAILRPAVSAMQSFAVILIVASLLGVFALLYQNLRERRYDLAVMRAMGGGPWLVFRLTLLEGLFMILIGLGSGLFLGHAATELLGQLSQQGRAMDLSGLVWVSAESWLVLTLLVAGSLVALIPAVLAWRTEVATTLRRGY